MGASGARVAGRERAGGRTRTEPSERSSERSRSRSRSLSGARAERLGRRGWRAGRLPESSGIRPGGPPPAAAAPRSSGPAPAPSRRGKYWGALARGGPARPGGNGAASASLFFAGAAGEGRAGRTHAPAFVPRSLSGRGGAPGEDKGTAGDAQEEEVEEGDYDFGVLPCPQLDSCRPPFSPGLGLFFGGSWQARHGVIGDTPLLLWFWGTPRPDLGSAS